MIQAVLQQYQLRNPNAQVLYTTAERFLHEFMKKAKADRDLYLKNKAGNANAHYESKHLDAFKASCEGASIWVIENFDAL